MITRFKRYPGGKILGFGATPQMQKRQYYPGYETRFINFYGVMGRYIRLTTYRYLFSIQVIQVFS